ncbi:unnamed protein product [Vitrella brassicaformis CCMP3155]|uniref:Uncharacterized protein n=1 Tax=Vitrella brassicaformis (strain CCMP3155) TaxID=1169540 RepID=A0A0G4EP47_VITBC|nr:unnamed protein product [Vitrella brassicaformis CCMP3155]|eukprot:CEL99399.1 unnamed protein product [Vitrella brassicaformis CCMP3155]
MPDDFGQRGRHPDSSMRPLKHSGLPNIPSFSGSTEDRFSIFLASGKFILRFYHTSVSSDSSLAIADIAEGHFHPVASPAAMAASSSDAKPGGGRASESDEERQRRAEREIRFWVNAPPGLISIVMAFLPINLLIQLQLPPLMWQHAARKQHHLTISAADDHERSFWQRITIDVVKEWATHLRQLTSMILRHPVRFPMWCFDVFVAIIEGHIAGRRAANIQGGTLHTITIKKGVRLTGTARQSVARTNPPLPAPLDPFPTLNALETIEGLTREHRQLADRHCLVPSLATVRQEGWWADGYLLGRLITSSRSLRCVDGSLDGEGWADVLERIPAAPAGQLKGGLLAQLESIGTIVVNDAEHDEDDLAGIERLQEVLVARGCRRSLKQLHVALFAACIDRHSIPILLALDRLVTRCCRADAPLTLTTALVRSGFDLSIFCDNNFPSHPSPSLKTMIQQLAQQATSVAYTFTQDGLTDPHTSPSPSAIEMAKTLSFDKATEVVVEDAPGFHLPATTPPPHPAIITHMQPFPKASGLEVWSKLSGAAAARLFASKMPKELTSVHIGFMSGGERLGVLTALGRDRKVGTVKMGDIGVDQLEQLLVGAADGLPTIGRLDFALTLPDGVEDAGSFVRARLSSVVLCIRGLRHVELRVDRTTNEHHGSIEASLAVGTNIEATNIGAFTIKSIRRVNFGGTWVKITAPSDA